MTNLSRVVPVGLVLALGACASSPPADRIVYEVREVPLFVERGGQIPPASTTYVRDDPAAEAARRAWLEEHYGARRAARTEVVREERYVPQPEVVRERVVVVEREPHRVWVPPVRVGVGYYGGRHHRGHWGWGVGWGWPLFWGW